jgi:hypothetical protein
MSLREDVELYTKLSGEDGSQETIATIGAYLRGYRQGKADAEPHWIPVTERLPEEEDSIFARYYGTDRWRKAMFRKKSREVIVTSVFEDGELHTEVAHTTDGEWHVGVNVVPRTVIAWMPLPEPYKGVTDGRD